MANIKLGALVADIRGSIGGTCFSRGGGGAIARNAPKPCNPRSASQSDRRAILAQVAQRWGTVLTEPERTAWRAYAAGTSWTNKVGTSASISGMAAYVRLNSLRMMAGLTVEDTAPITVGHAGTPTFTFLAKPTLGHITIALPSAPFDKDTDDSTMVFFQHIAANPGQLAIPGNKRYLGKVIGDGTIAPTFPLNFTVIFPLGVGQRIFVTGIHIDPTGRIGGDYTISAIAANP